MHLVVEKTVGSTPVWAESTRPVKSKHRDRWCVNLRHDAAPDHRRGSRNGNGYRVLRVDFNLSQSVGENEPFASCQFPLPYGAPATPEEVGMAVRIKWAEKAGYSVLTKRRSREFAPCTTR